MAKSKSQKSRYNFGYGAIYQRKTKNGKIRWYLDYRNGNGNRIQKVAPLVTSKEEAVFALREEVSQSFNREHGIQKKRDKIKFIEFADEYMENYAKVNKVEKSWKTDDYYLKGMKEFFGDLYLHEFTLLEIEKYKSHRIKQGVRTSTINRCLTIIRKMFNLAVDWEVLQKNQISKIKFYSEKDNLMERILTRPEEERLLGASSEHLKPILIVALNSGMRLSEILTLQWKFIDLNAKKIRLVKTKSGRIRIININSNLLNELFKLKQLNGDPNYLFFNEQTGKPLTTVKRSFKGACERANISGLRFHDLRHTFATRLVEMGVDIITVKELLGHSSVTITERYTHSFHEQKEKAVELLVEKAPKTDQKEENLLHICDMESCGKKRSPINPYVSVN